MIGVAIPSTTLETIADQMTTDALVRLLRRATIDPETTTVLAMVDTLPGHMRAHDRQYFLSTRLSRSATMKMRRFLCRAALLKMCQMCNS